MAPDVQTLLQQAKQLASDERVELIKGLEDSLRTARNPEQPDYVALFGSGRGAFATTDEADAFTRQERDGGEN